MSEESLVETKFVHDIRVQMRDGVELSADLYIPRTGRTVPHDPVPDSVRELTRGVY